MVKRREAMLAINEYFDFVKSLPFAEESNSASFFDIDFDVMKFLVDTVDLYLTELSEFFGESTFNSISNQIVDSLRVDNNLIFSSNESPELLATIVTLIELRGLSLIEISFNKTNFNDVTQAFKDAANGCISQFFTRVKENNIRFNLFDSSINNSDMII